ncbi:MAG TPA: DUF4349 domain-containing protein [Pontimonas sp.]|nr:DUF4349 domain-containing protein [Pontimonas sp.]
MTRVTKISALTFASILTLTGCAPGADSLEQSSMGSAEMAYTEDMALDLQVQEGMDRGSLEPDIIRTGFLSLSVDSPSDTADRITEVVEAAGGRIASRSDYTPVDFGQPSSYLEARIPYEALDDTVASLQDLGDVQEVSLNTVDVSLQRVDLDARIQVLEAAISRLNELLAEAATTSDLIAVESALSERQAELDSLQSQRDYLSDQTLFATLSISLITPANAMPSDPDGFLDGIIRGWESILAFFAGVIVWAGILVPWVGLAAVVVLLGILVRRIRRRSR